MVGATDNTRVHACDQSGATFYTLCGMAFQSVKPDKPTKKSPELKPRCPTCEARVRQWERGRGEFAPGVRAVDLLGTKGNPTIARLLRHIADLTETRL